MLAARCHRGVCFCQRFSLWLLSRLDFSRPLVSVSTDVYCKVSSRGASRDTQVKRGHVEFTERWPWSNPTSVILQCFTLDAFCWCFCRQAALRAHTRMNLEIEPPTLCTKASGVSQQATPAVHSCHLVYSVYFRWHRKCHGKHYLVPIHSVECRNLKLHNHAAVWVTSDPMLVLSLMCSTNVVLTLKFLMNSGSLKKRNVSFGIEMVKKPKHLQHETHLFDVRGHWIWKHCVQKAGPSLLLLWFVKGLYFCIYDETTDTSWWRHK